MSIEADFQIAKVSKMLGILTIAFFLPLLLATPFERDGKIIGGIAAKRGQFPYQVALLYSSRSMFCGASILTESILLTAAHCTMTRPTDFKAVAGSLSYINYLRENGQLRGVVKFLMHENYTNVGQGYDIALAKVDQPFVFNNFVNSVALSTS